jgi:predicted dehydrogenase
LIGCGQIALSVHLPILARLPGVRLAALAEADPTRLAEAGRRAPGAARLADYRDVLRRPEIEAVVVCLPTALHAEAAMAAFAHGKHVYLEKPIATDLGEARGVLDAWRAAGTVGMVGFNYRFNPLYVAMRRMLREGRLGELVAARGVFTAAMEDLPDWKRRRSSGGGALLDLASHHIDLVRFFFGQPVTAVTAEIGSRRSEGDSASLSLRLADGLLVQLLCSLFSVEEDRVEIYGRGGKLAVDRYRSLAPALTPPKQGGAAARLGAGLRSIAGARRLAAKLIAPGQEPSYRVALAEFVAAVRERRPVSPDLGDGYRSLAVIVAAEEAARTGRTMELTEAADGLPEVKPAAPGIEALAGGERGTG